MANGNSPSPALLERLALKADALIATDGAANRLSGSAIRPDVVLGDFDSITSKARQVFAEAEFVEAEDQEACDLDKAIGWAIERNAEEITLTGCLGGRLDHELTTISLLLKYRGNYSLSVVDDAGEYRAVAEGQSVTIKNRQSATLSLIVFQKASGVTATGVRWPLNEETLVPGSRGVSNEIVASEATVSIREGTAILCILNETYDKPDENRE